MPTLQDMTQISQPHVWFTTSEGGGGRFAYLSHVLDTYDVEKQKKTMKQHQTYQPLNRDTEVFFLLHRSPLDKVEERYWGSKYCKRKGLQI